MREEFVEQSHPRPKWLIIFALVFSGEMIFSLPFHLTRFFRPTFMEVFDMSNAALGDIFAVYGIAAMLAYFPGGMITDRYSPRRLMSVSLLATALGGLYLAQLPGRTGFTLIFGWWGITTILLFWAAMIKAMRQCGGASTQGRGFGILEGGRGLIAAGGATIAVFILGTMLQMDPENVTDSQRTQALQAIIYFYCAATATAAALVWFVIPDTVADKSFNSVSVFQGVGQVLRQKIVWLQSAIVISAYCGYKGLDFYSIYAVAALGMNELEAAEFMSVTAYIRPIAAVTAGYLADRFLASRIIVFSFLLLSISYILLAVLSPSSVGLTIIYANLLVSFAAVFSLRGIYFALLEESKIAGRLTGTAVGVISVIGFTPDIFFAPIAGRILDSGAGLSGQQSFFMLLVFFSTLGLVASATLAHLNRSQKFTQPTTT